MSHQPKTKQNKKKAEIVYGDNREWRAMALLMKQQELGTQLTKKGLWNGRVICGQQVSGFEIFEVMKLHNASYLLGVLKRCRYAVEWVDELMKT